MDEETEWKLWQGWLGREPKGQTIYAQIVEMLVWRQVWDAFAMIHDSAPESARKYPLFSTWLRWNYARTQGLAVRKQADVARDVVSLGRLIDRVWRYPTVLSVERFASLEAIGDEDGERWFHELTGSDGPFIDPRVPARDLTDLRDTTAKIRTWVNKGVAHATPAALKADVSIEEIHEAVDFIALMFRKYANLVLGVSVEVSEVILTPWPAIFKEAWVPPERQQDVAQAIQAQTLARRAKLSQPPV